MFLQQLAECLTCAQQISDVWMFCCQKKKQEKKYWNILVNNSPKVNNATRIQNNTSVNQNLLLHHNMHHTHNNFSFNISHYCGKITVKIMIWLFLVNLKRNHLNHAYPPWFNNHRLKRSEKYLYIFTTRHFINFTNSL